MIDFRKIETAIVDEFRAEGLEVYSFGGDWFVNLDDEGGGAVSLTKIADRVASSLGEVGS